MEQLDAGGIREPEARQIELEDEPRGEERMALCIEDCKPRLIELALELQAYRLGGSAVS